MIKSISISELAIGMYVENVVKQKGSVRIKSKGLIKTQSILDTLKAKGILEIEVNLSKSKGIESTPPGAKAVEQLDVSEPASDISDTHHLALAKADKLYTQARFVQQNFVTQLRTGSTPNINDLSDLSQDIIDSVFDNSDALSCLLMLKDSNEYLVEHAINCAILLTVFAKYKEMSQAEVEDLTIAGLLMDIGMASLPNDLLTKPTELNETDWAMVRTHVDIGIELVERLDDVQPIVLDVIQNHHERINGSGYPKGKTASEISIYAQMAAIVDSYDAMISEHDHRSSNAATVALKKLQQDETLDRDLVTEFINAIGLHPVGSLVQLQTQALGIVSQRNKNVPLEPIVMVFYSMNSQSPSDIQRIDLSQTEDYIVTGVRPEEFSINLGSFFKTVFTAS